MASEIDNAKIGAGHASAMARQGLHELRAAIYPESNVAQQPEMGTYGTLTPGEVADSRKAEGQEREEGTTYDYGEESGSVLGERLQQAEAREAEPTREEPSMERE